MSRSPSVSLYEIQVKASHQKLSAIEIKTHTTNERRNLAENSFSGSKMLDRTRITKKLFFLFSRCAFLNHPNAHLHKKHSFKYIFFAGIHTNLNNCVHNLFITTLFSVKSFSFHTCIPTFHFNIFLSINFFAAL